MRKVPTATNHANHEASPRLKPGLSPANRASANFLLAFLGSTKIKPAKIKLSPRLSARLRRASAELGLTPDQILTACAAIALGMPAKGN